jgi:hypothetical protein
LSIVSSPGGKRTDAGYSTGKEKRAATTSPDFKVTVCRTSNPHDDRDKTLTDSAVSEAQVVAQIIDRATG